VQEAGDVWMSGTTWDGRRAIRISVSNWQTTDEEIDLALEAFRKATSQSPAHAPAR
jgi:cysteine sulfinate desulfinase/cysteine desulfurase-like protein